MRVFDSQGSRVDDGNTVFDRNDETAASVGVEPLPDGVYTVAWRNVSKVDGHLVRGSFLFSVGVPLSGAQIELPDKPLFNFPAEPVLRWLTLLSALAMVGGPVFELLVARPVLFGREAVESLRKLGKSLASRTSKLMWAASAVFLASAPADVPGEPDLRSVGAGHAWRPRLVNNRGHDVGTGLAMADAGGPGTGGLACLPARSRPRFPW